MLFVRVGLSRSQSKWQRTGTRRGIVGTVTTPLLAGWHRAWSLAGSAGLDAYHLGPVAPGDQHPVASLSVLSMAPIPGQSARTRPIEIRELQLCTATSNSGAWPSPLSAHSATSAFPGRQPRGAELTDNPQTANPTLPTLFRRHANAASMDENFGSPDKVHRVVRQVETQQSVRESRKIELGFEHFGRV